MRNGVRVPRRIFVVPAFFCFFDVGPPVLDVVPNCPTLFFPSEKPWVKKTICVLAACDPSFTLGLSSLAPRGFFWAFFTFHYVGWPFSCQTSHSSWLRCVHTPGLSDPVDGFALFVMICWPTEVTSSTSPVLPIIRPFFHRCVARLGGAIFPPERSRFSHTGVHLSGLRKVWSCRRCFTTLSSNPLRSQEVSVRPVPALFFSLPLIFLWAPIALTIWLTRLAWSWSFLSKAALFPFFSLFFSFRPSRAVGP